MHYYSIIRSRAGLVALVFALIISLVSAIPIPTAGFGSSSTLLPNSNPSLNGLPEVDTAKISLSGRMSTLPTSTRALTRRDISTNMDDQLVRRSVGSKIRAVFQKVETGIKHVAQKAVEGVKTAVKKVDNFVRTQGAAVAKFGLKVVESVGEAVGHAAAFIPAIGKPIQEVIHGVSEVAGFASDHIKAKLSSKLQKGTNIMNKADKVMSYIPRRRDFSEEDSFLQRDISEAYFEERDDIALENREESYFDAIERDIYERYDLD
jgi:ElaB/YqjD/DUF883 family membrane-anchored ribosome-binding protein